MGADRAIMASLGEVTWEDAQQLISAWPRPMKEHPSWKGEGLSWEGQECGDRSGNPDGCPGRLLVWVDAEGN